MSEKVGGDAGFGLNSEVPLDVERLLVFEHVRIASSCHGSVFLGFKYIKKPIVFFFIQYILHAGGIFVSLWICSE